MTNRNAPITGASCPEPHRAGRWHIVHTNARMERMVAKTLMQKGFAVHYPHFEASVRHARKIVRDLLPLYPRYLFAAVQPGQAVWDINHCPGVSTVVYRGPAPVIVPAAVMQHEVGRTDADGRMLADELARIQGKAGPKRLFHVGQSVRVGDGPLAGFLAVVARLDSGDALRVWVDIFGRRTEVATVEGDLVAAEVG